MRFKHAVIALLGAMLAYSGIKAMLPLPTVTIELGQTVDEFLKSNTYPFVDDCDRTNTCSFGMRHDRVNINLPIDGETLSFPDSGGPMMFQSIIFSSPEGIARNPPIKNPKNRIESLSIIPQHRLLTIDEVITELHRTEKWLRDHGFVEDQSEYGPHRAFQANSAILDENAEVVDLKIEDYDEFKKQFLYNKHEIIAVNGFSLVKGKRAFWSEITNIRRYNHRGHGYKLRAEDTLETEQMYLIEFSYFLHNYIE